MVFICMQKNFNAYFHLSWYITRLYLYRMIMKNTGKQF